MKNLLMVCAMFLLMGVNTCDREPTGTQVFTEDVYADKFEFDGHAYIGFALKTSNRLSVVHDPKCKGEH